MERDIKGRFLPKGYYWYDMDDGRQVLANSLTRALLLYGWWIENPIEVEWIR